MAGGQHASEEAVLPQVPVAAVVRIVVLRVAALNASHQNAYGVGSSRNGDEMKMIRHQTSGQNSHLGLFEILAQKVQVCVVVLTR